MDSPRSVLTPSPAFQSLGDRRPFFNDGSPNIVQVSRT